MGVAAPDTITSGDAKRDASLIVWTMAGGRKVAMQADEFLMGRGLLPG